MPTALPDPREGGYLWKEGHNRKNWKRRWFVLEEQQLRYYATPDALEPIGTVALQGSSVVTCKHARQGKFAFRLAVEKTADGNSHDKYILAGDSEAESLHWAKSLIDEGASGDLKALSVAPKPAKRAGFLSFFGGKSKAGNDGGRDSKATGAALAAGDEDDEGSGEEEDTGEMRGFIVGDDGDEAEESDDEEEAEESGSGDDDDEEDFKPKKKKGKKK